MVRQNDRCGQDGFWRGRFIAQRRVRSGRVVVVSPALDEGFGFAEVVENFAGQQLISELGVEAFAVAILPGTCRRDVKRCNANIAEPFP